MLFVPNYFPIRITWQLNYPNDINPVEIWWSCDHLSSKDHDYSLKILWSHKFQLKMHQKLKLFVSIAFSFFRGIEQVDGRNNLDAKNTQQITLIQWQRSKFTNQHSPAVTYSAFINTDNTKHSLLITEKTTFYSQSISEIRRFYFNWKLHCNGMRSM